GEERHDEGGGDDTEERPVGAPEGAGRRSDGDDGENGRGGVLHAPDHATPAPPPREDREREGRGYEIQPDAVRQVVDEVAAEDESGEGNGEDHLDGADHRSGRDEGQHSLGSALSGHGPLRDLPLRGGPYPPLAPHRQS